MGINNGIAAAFGLAGTAATLALTDRFLIPINPLETDDTRFLFPLACVVAAKFAAFIAWRSASRVWAREVPALLFATIGIAIGWSHRSDMRTGIMETATLALDRFEIVLPYRIGDGIATIRAQASGFVPIVQVNDTNIRLTIDPTLPASVLRETDARRIGVTRKRPLAYTQTVQTPRGEIKLARATLDEVRIQGVGLRNVPVWVAKVGAERSILGADFLRIAGKFETTPRTLRISQEGNLFAQRIRTNEASPRSSAQYARQ